MDIYSLLKSLPHNPHYLNRYYNYILNCFEYNSKHILPNYTENHHICPAAKTMFFEYKSFKKHPWNKIKLTARQHFIAHHILWKAYPKFSGMALAFHCMTIQNSKHKERIFKINSKIYEKLKIEYSNHFSKHSSKIKPWVKKMIEKRKITKPYNGKLNPNAKKWKLTDPLGNNYFINGEFHQFCEKMQLSRGALQLNKGSFVPSISNKFREQYPGNKFVRTNTIGWKLESIN